MSRPRNPGPTIPDVARAAGVSTATAGRALGSYGYVSAEVRERVLRAAQELGYRPNHIARSMITRRTETIGVVGADIENPFFAQAMRGISDAARERGIGTILTNSDEDVEIERDAVRVLLQKQVDGIIVAPAASTKTTHLAEAVAQGTPVVLLDRTVAGLEADSVVVDNIEAAQGAVGKLLALGHRRIAVIAELRQPAKADWGKLSKPGSRIDLNKLNPSSLRLWGYLRAHWQAGVPVAPELIRRTGTYSSESAFEQMRRLLALPKPPTAVFASDNLMSLGAYEAVRSSEVRVPEDLSVVAFDDLDWTKLVTPALSVIAQPVYEMGAEAARRLLRRIEDGSEPPRQTMLKTTYIERDSTAPPRRLLPRSSRTAT